MALVDVIHHKMLGRMIRLTLPGGAVLDLMVAEASSLSRALLAVAEGRSRENQIYLSPMASDGEFFATVAETGMTVGDYLMPWAQVVELGNALADAITP